MVLRVEGGDLKAVANSFVVEGKGRTEVRGKKVSL